MVGYTGDTTKTKKIEEKLCFVNRNLHLASAPQFPQGYSQVH